MNESLACAQGVVTRLRSLEVATVYPADNFESTGCRGISANANTGGA